METGVILERTTQKGQKRYVAVIRIKNKQVWKTFRTRNDAKDHLSKQRRVIENLFHDELVDQLFALAKTVTVKAAIEIIDLRQQVADLRREVKSLR